MLQTSQGYKDLIQKREGGREREGEERIEAGREGMSFRGAGSWRLAE